MKTLTNHKPAVIPARKPTTKTEIIAQLVNRGTLSQAIPSSLLIFSRIIASRVPEIPNTLLFIFISIIFFPLSPNIFERCNLSVLLNPLLAKRTHHGIDALDIARLIVRRAVDHVWVLARPTSPSH